MSKSVIILLLLACIAGMLRADLFSEAAKSLKGSANEAVEKAQDDANEAASGSLAESLSSAQSAVNQATATQKMVAQTVDASKQLESMLGDNPELKSLLTNSMVSLAQGQDFAALQDLNSLMDAKLTPDQMGLAKGLRNDVEVLALKRSLPQSGPVTAATQALQSGDFTAAQTQLTQVMQNGSLTDPQKQLVQTIMGNHSGTVAETADTANAIIQQ
ncbi:MAG: hypothetical protein ACQKBV_00905 [Puniceicoccales bacterium]